MPPTTATQLVEEAAHHVREEEYEKAIDASRRALDSDSRSGDAYSILGIALARAQRGEEATEALKTAVQSAPYVARHYYNLALHYDAMGAKNDSIAMCQEAIRCDSKHRRALALLQDLESATHTEAAPYMASIGDQKGSAYHYKENDKPAPPPLDPLAESEDGQADKQ